MIDKKKKCQVVGCDRDIVYRGNLPTSKYCPNHHYIYASQKAKEKSKVNYPKIIKHKSPRLRAINRADEWFSRYMRLLYAKVFNGELFIRCYTCGRYFPLKKIDNGHFVGRRYHKTRWDQNNTRPQCIKCNRFNEGMKLVFEMQLVKELGKPAIEQMKLDALEIANYSELQIREIAKNYRLEVKRLQEKIGVKIW